MTCALVIAGYPYDKPFPSQMSGIPGQQPEPFVQTPTHPVASEYTAQEQYELQVCAVRVWFAG